MAPLATVSPRGLKLSRTSCSRIICSIIYSFGAGIVVGEDAGMQVHVKEGAVVGAEETYLSNRSS